MKALYFFILILLFACESDKIDELEIESMRGDGDSDIVDESSSANEYSEESIWVTYEGRMGSYEQQVIIELGVLGTEVTGRYFYARHQKYLALEGTYDTLTKEYNLVESYRGKITGYIQFIKDENDNLEGSWSKLIDGDPEPFNAKLMILDFEGEQRMDVNFSRYDYRHEVLTYNGISNESDAEFVIDEIMISQLDDTYFLFHYSIIGGNGHIGSIDGIGTMTTADSAEYYSVISGCTLNFGFEEDSISIFENENCAYFRGMRANFTGKLGKIEKGLAF